jgi:hypothetical protein
MEKLVIIAGVPCTGKSTFVRHLTAGKHRDVAAWFGETDCHGWPSILASHLRNFDGPVPDRLIVHFEFLRWPKDGCGAQAYLRAFPPRLAELVQQARDISILTFWTDPERLVRRMRVRDFLAQIGSRRLLRPLARVLSRCRPLAERAECFSRVIRRPSSRRAQIILSIYQTHGQVASLYRDWFEYFESAIRVPFRHELVEINGCLRFGSYDRWNKAVCEGRDVEPVALAEAAPFR